MQEGWADEWMDGEMHRGLDMQNWGLGRGLRRRWEGGVLRLNKTDA